MYILKFILVILFTTVSFSLTAQDEIKSKKQVRIQQHHEKKEQRQIRREERKEKRKEKRTDKINKTVELSEVQTQDTVQSEPALSVEPAITSEQKAQNQPAAKQEDTVPQPKEKNQSSQNYLTPMAIATQINVDDREAGNESNNDAGSSDSDDNSSAILAIFFILAIICLFKYLFHRKCPNCKTKLSMRDINEEFMGHTRQSREQGKDGKYHVIYYSNIKVTRKCSHCGYVDYVIKERKGNGMI